MNAPSQPYTFDRVVRILITVLVVAGLFWLIGSLSGILTPFFTAALVAYLMFPLVKRIQKVVKSRGLAILGAILFYTLILAIVAVILIPSLGRELKVLGDFLQSPAFVEYWNNLFPAEQLEQIEQRLQSQNIQDLVSEEQAQSLLEQFGQSVSQFFTGVLNAVGGVFGIVTFTLYLVFILIDYESLAKGWKEFIPPKYRGQIVSLVGDVEDGMQAYFKAQSRIVLWVSILFAVGFKLIDLPMGIIMGIFVGLLNFVPYLQFAGLIPITFLALVHSIDTGSSFWVMMALVGVVFGVVQLIQEAILTPRIMGNLTGMNPAIMLLALSIWGSWLGIIGMIIALPITTLLISYYKRFILKIQPEEASEPEPPLEEAT